MEFFEEVEVIDEKVVDRLSLPEVDEVIMLTEDDEVLDAKVAKIGGSAISSSRFLFKLLLSHKSPSLPEGNRSCLSESSISSLLA